MLRSISAALLLGSAFAAQAISPGTPAIAPHTCRFMENKGQVGDQHHNPRPDVLFGGTDGKLTYHLRNSGVSYQLYRVDTWKEDPMTQRQKRPGMRAPLSSGEGLGVRAHKVPDRMTIQRIDIEWIGANTHAPIERTGESADYDNFYNATAPDGVTGVRSYESVRYKNLYPGIDLKWYTTDGKVKYDFEVSAGADHSRIALRINGADKLSINEAGELVISTPLGEIIEERPVVVQDGRMVKGDWTIVNGDEVRVTFTGIDRKQAFVIDPGVRSWGTYYGQDFTTVWATSTDASENAYIVGETGPTLGSMVATTGSHQTAFNFFADGYLAKFNADGQRLWGTYYGGEGYDITTDCSVDANGNIGVSGITNSMTAIATTGSHRPVNAWPSTEIGIANVLFVAKFEMNGARMWGTYYGPVTLYVFGGSSVNFKPNCSSDAAGAIYVTANTELDTTSGVLSTVGAHQPVHGGSLDALLVKFSSSGARQWATYYGGAGHNIVSGCDVDAIGNVYIGGTSMTNDGAGVVATANGHQPDFGTGAGEDAFLVKFDPLGIRQWGTYYGGGNGEVCAGISTNGTDRVALIGNIIGYGIAPSNEPGVISTSGTYQVAPPDWAVSYLATFDLNGSRSWGSYLTEVPNTGGYMDLQACSMGPEGDLFVTGRYNSSVIDSSATLATDCVHQPYYAGISPSDPLYGTGSGTVSALLLKFDTLGQRDWGTFYGGVGSVEGYDCSATVTGQVYLGGSVVNYPPSIGSDVATPDGHQTVISYWLMAEGDAINGFIALFAPPGTSICGNTLSALSAGDDYQWIDCSTNQPIPGATDSTFTFTQAGSYAAIIYNGACADTTVCRTVVVPDPLVVSITSTPSCQPNSGSAVATVSGGIAPYTYEWSPSGGTDSLATDLAPGTYTCVVTDSTGCTTAEDQVTIVQAPPPQVTTSGDITIGACGQTTLQASGGAQGASYTWSPATDLSCTECPQTIAQPEITTEYCVLLTEANGCTDTTCVTITIDGTAEVYVPNAFSPNANGTNDAQCVYGGCISTMVFTIYDRWGTKVFESTDPKTCWDGSHNGQELDPAVFVYHLTATMATGEVVEKSGNITLVR